MAFCRRADYLAFRAAWASGNASLGLGLTPLAPDIDRVLHGERLGPGGSKRTYTAPLATLPDGVFVRLLGASADPADAEPYLRWQDALWRWTLAGDVGRRPLVDEPV